MKPLIVITLLGICALAVNEQARAQDALPEIAREAVERMKKDCGDPVEIKPGFVQTRDINDDKEPDYILDYEHARCGEHVSYWCGTGGCHTQVFASLGDGKYAEVLDQLVRRIRFARVKKRPAMILDLHGSVCGRGGYAACGMTLYWNGETFHPAN